MNKDYPGTGDDLPPASASNDDIMMDRGQGARVTAVIVRERPMERKQEVMDVLYILACMDATLYRVEYRPKTH